MTAEPGEMIPVADLPAPLRPYLKREELDAGQISRRVLRERQRGAEGRVVADARQHGTPLLVAERAAGESVHTTAATEHDTTARTR